MNDVQCPRCGRFVNGRRCPYCHQYLEASRSGIILYRILRDKFNILVVPIIVVDRMPGGIKTRVYMRRVDGGVIRINGKVNELTMSKNRDKLRLVDGYILTK